MSLVEVAEEKAGASSGFLRLQITDRVFEGEAETGAAHLSRR